MLVFLAAGLARGADGSGARTEPLFYKGLDYGSQSQFNPLSVITNEAFDISQMEGCSRSLPQQLDPDAFGRLNGSLLHPFTSIDRMGTERFLTSEIIPTSFRPSRAQWIPNYQLHLVGSGMRNAALEEWWKAHGCTHPGIAAAATTYLAQYLNEVSEISHKTSYRDEDPVADIYIFDLAGILLFQPQAVREFFASTVELSNWPLQPSWQAPGTELGDVGEYWALKIPLPSTEHWKLFYYMGLGNIGGVTRTFSGGDAVSLGAGAYAKTLHSAGDGANTVTVAPKLGVFWDRNGSLMASAFYNGQSVERVLVNIYPGVLPTGPLHLGCWGSLGPLGPHIGITTTVGLGAGI
jgi:hypothetical protein